MILKASDGRALWKPRFRNWLCSAEQAAGIRQEPVAQKAGETI
jgi:hypothetical protein